MKLLRILYLSSLHVALATGVCAAAFFELTGSTPGRQWISLSQIVVICWMIYILDRLLDVIRGNVSTERHRFHHQHQYNLQIAAVALGALAVFFLFFQSKEILIYGSITGAAVLLYLIWVVPRFPGAKDYVMPLIYLSAVVGVPFVAAPAITLSAWIIALMFALVVFQNLTSFAYFEQGKPLKRKTVTWLGAINLFLFILFFSGSREFPTKLALIFTLISVFYSFIISNEKRFSARYRWIMDTLLFLPLLIL